MSVSNVWPGNAYPLGASFDGYGVNFALFSAHAEGVQLLLFYKSDERKPAKVVALRERTAFVWHCYVPDLKPPLFYAYRVKGLYQPQKGYRFNATKVLIDPYAKAISGTIEWHDSLLGYRQGNPEEDLSYNNRDSCAFIPKGVVLDTSYDWEGDKLLQIPWRDTVIYEVHVKGITKNKPGVNEEERGTYRGLGSPTTISFLKDLGITAVELLPVHHHVDEKGLVARGLNNYWGYNTIGYFAPDCRYSSSGNDGQQVHEFKDMVKALHKAGIEIIIDVVYSHTAEGDQLGPTLSFRGIDNLSYYHLSPKNPRYYMDFTGTGNSLCMSEPQVTQLIMDSLRYWVLEMHVDGFRFDLASTLARELFEVDKLSAFFDMIHQDPVLSRVKLIAEPWDLGPGGYQVGNFPPLWAEWNGKFRDTVRRFWKGDQGQIPDLAYRLTGSSDLYNDDGRNPYASINFVTCHDGFTLNDLVSYKQKHNEANLEGNRDGTNDNLSWNCGAEGFSDDSGIKALRERQKRNFFATLLISQGVPMILGGDEMGRTQVGNNNAYCQDNEISWYNWELDDTKLELLDFVRNLIHLRMTHPAFRRRKFFKGLELCKTEIKDITWLKPNGDEMAESDWKDPALKSLGICLSGDAITEPDQFGRPIRDDTFLMLLNASDRAISFEIPGPEKPWQRVFDTFFVGFEKGFYTIKKGEKYQLEGRSLALFCKKRGT